MMNTRRISTPGTIKPTPPATKPPERSRESLVTAAVLNPDLEPGDAALNELLASLSKELKTLVKIMKTIITKQFRTELEMLKEEIDKKDTVIQN